MYKMNIKNSIKISFAFFAGIFCVGQLLAQKQDSTVVNLGYGVTVTPSEVSSSVGVTTAKDLSKFFAINPENALFGQIPGLTVLQNGGNWWQQSPTILVRGQANLDNTSAPLVLIDGFERSLASINVNDIESISVLKDAGATAIYGQRGANGVILVTTKRGIKEGKEFDFSYEYSVNQPFRIPQMLDAYGYANAINEALALDGQDFRYSKEQLDAYKDGSYPYYYPNVNWFDEVLRNTGFVNDVNATFRGGKGRTRYFVSLNYLGGQGLLRQDRNNADYSTQLNYDRASIRTNLDMEVTKSTMLRFDLYGQISGTNRPGKATSTQLFETLYGTPANAFPVQYEDGKWGGSPVYNRNPVADVNETGFATSNRRTFYANLTLIQDLSSVLEGLSVSGAASFDNYVEYWDSKTKNYAYVYNTADIDEINGVLYNFTSTDFGETTALAFSTQFGGQNRHANGIIKANYDQEWGKHKFNAMLLFHTDNEVGLGQNNTFHRNNYAGNFQYVYNKKYIAALSMSYSGNNILPEGHHFRFYPALSLGWLMSNEDFLSGSGIVNYLKLRASAGYSGLEPNQQYLHLQKYGSGNNYFYGDNNTQLGGLREYRRAITNFNPEKSFMSNLGVDATLFGGLSLNIDAFYEKRSNILVSESNSVSRIIGVDAANVPEGIVENKGVEIGALWSNSNSDFNYAIGVQYSFARNKIINQNEVFRPWDYLKRTGHPVGQIFGLEADGFWGVNDGLNGTNNISPEGVVYTYTSVLKPGDVKYVDQNGDKVIDQFDMVAIGRNWLPEMYYSFTLDAEYKGFGISALFQGVFNVSTTLNTAGIFWPLFNNNNISTFSNDRWTPATAGKATLPRLTPEKNDNNYRTSTIWVRDISYLKLRTLELYYNLPKNLVEKVKLKMAKVFVRGINLFSIDNIKIMDPEELRTVYPTLKSYNIGLKVDF